MLNIRGIKARPNDLGEMMAHRPSLVEMHCSMDDLKWMPSGPYNVELAVHLPEYYNGRLINPASLDESERQFAADAYTRAVARASEWAQFFKGKTAKIIFHPGGMSVRGLSPKDSSRARMRLDVTIAAMRRATDGQNTEILVENLPAHCWFFGGEWLAGLGTRAEEMVSICKENGLNMTLDLCHLYLAANAQKFDVAHAIDTMRPFVRHIHYSGAKGVDGEGLAVDDPSSTFDVASAISRLQDLPVSAVPEIWFGHENGGKGFKAAWDALEASPLLKGNR